MSTAGTGFFGSILKWLEFIMKLSRDTLLTIRRHFLAFGAFFIYAFKNFWLNAYEYLQRMYDQLGVWIGQAIQSMEETEMSFDMGKVTDHMPDIANAIRFVGRIFPYEILAGDVILVGVVVGVAYAYRLVKSWIPTVA